MENHRNIESYIASFSEKTQKLLHQVHQAVREVVPPETEEAIKYGIPTFVLKGKNVVHYGGFKSHIGFYPSASGIVAFEKKLATYKTSKGAVQFPISEPLPVEIIRQIATYRVKEVLKKK